ncbi:MAG: response regulator transcription factor [Chloroflexota bacterium]
MQAILFSPHADEAAILTTVLQQAGFTVRAIRDLDQAMEAWPERPADLILLTLSGSKEGALKQIKQMRIQTAVPFIVITDTLPEDLQVDILEAGADLVISRPYGVRFLLAQIKTLLRRSAGVPFFSLPTLTQSGVTLDPSARTVTVGDRQPNRLTQLEFRLLYTLITNPGRVIPSENLVESVWGYSGEGNRELVRGLIQRLRTKVEPDPSKPRYILTEAGIGYYFNRFD